MLRPFSCRSSSGTSREIGRLSFPFIDLYVRFSRHDFTAVRLHCNLRRTQRPCFSVTYIRACIVSEQRKMTSRCHGGIIDIAACTAVTMRRP
jgi:hypothetical protein